MSSCEGGISQSDNNIPNQRSVYLVTYSQCDASGLTRQSFANLIVEAWTAGSRSKVVQWVCSQEAHADGGNHFHMALKLSVKKRWLAVRNYVKNNHGIDLNFSDSHDNYYTAYTYVVKEYTEFVMSENHPDLSNTCIPVTTNATRKRRGNLKSGKSEKRKRLSVFDVVQIIQTRKINTRLELMAQAAKWEKERKMDLAQNLWKIGGQKLSTRLWRRQRS